METYNKPPLTFRQQVDLLVNRGLIVSDPTNAEQFLSQVNYYRLSAYCLPFDKSRHQFHKGISFEKIRQLYEFDRRLRFLIDEVLEVIEVSFRTALAYYLVHTYNAFVHEDMKNFFHKFDHGAWIAKVHEETSRSRETFIKHFESKYSGFPKLPLWMAVEVMSFGSLSQLFHGLLRVDQRELAQKIGFHSVVLVSWLHTFTYIRNMCAHHSRIWNRELAIAMTVPRNSKWNGINTKRVGTVIFAINHFLNKLPIEQRIKTDWKAEMNTLLSQPVDIPNFYLSMGLPESFLSHELWKIE